MLLTQHWSMFSGSAKEWMTLNNVCVLFIENSWMNVYVYAEKCDLSFKIFVNTNKATAYLSR